MSVPGAPPPGSSQAGAFEAAVAWEERAFENALGLWEEHAHPKVSRAARDASDDTSQSDYRWVSVNESHTSALPWALLATGVFGAGILTVIDAQFERSSSAIAAAWTTVLLVSAAAGIAAAAQRDVISRVTLLDGGLLAAAVALFSWTYPRFDPATVGWEESERWELAAMAAGLGALLASIITLGLIRHPPTASTVTFLAALALTLAAKILAAAELVISAILVLAAFASLAVSWTSRGSANPAWSQPTRRLRAPRIVMALTAAGIAGAAIEAGLRVERPSQPIGATLAAAAIGFLALTSTARSRRPVPHEQGALKNWLTWDHVRTPAEFEAALHEYVPVSARPLSEWTPEGELRLADDGFWSALGISSQLDFHFGSIAHPDDRADLATALTSGIGHRQPMDHTFRAVDPMTGIQRSIRLRAVPSHEGTVLIEAERLGGPMGGTSKLAGFDDPELRHRLTGLRNTAYVERWLRDYETENQRHSDTATLVIIESLPLDVFDRMSPLLRDVVITVAGHRLDTACREGDFLAHLDGPYFLLGARLSPDLDRNGLLSRIAALLDRPTATTPPVRLRDRMVTLTVEPGVDISRVLGVAAAAFTQEL